MKKLLSIILVLGIVLAVFTGCGKDDEQTDEQKKSELTFATVSETEFPAIPAELLTDEEYQFITLSDTEHVYKITETTNSRSHIINPVDGTITVKTSLTNSSTRSEKYTIALWKTDGSSMQYLECAYAMVDDKTYSHTFTGLDAATSYRVIVSADRGYATGKIAVLGGSLTQNATDEELEEE